jgi:uncharacterized delta-60 repeat protein
MKTAIRASLIASFLFGMYTGNAAPQLKSDNTFNTSGNKLIIDAAIGCSGLKMLVAQDGAVFVAGIHGNDSLAVWKLRADGTSDNTFGSDGHYAVSLGNLRPSALHINILQQRDKKIVVLAAAERVSVPIDNSESSIALLRLNTNGTPDMSFNGTGLLIHRPDQSYQFTPLSIAVDSTGESDKLYISSLAVENGSAQCPLGSGKWCISKYNSDGTPDASFNGTGHVLEAASYISSSPTQSPMAMPLSIRVTGSGHLLVAGAYHTLDAAFFMFRLHANGTMDNSFGQSGRVTIPFSSYAIASSQRTSARILADESVLFATHTDLYTNGQYDSSIINLTKCSAKGTIATTFGTNGTLNTSYSAEGHHQYSIDAENRILISWTAGKSSSQYLHLKSFNSDGTPNSSFGTNGYELMEPVLHDAVTYSTIYDATWTKDSKNLFVLSRRFDLTNRAHIGVFKLGYQEKNLAATSLSKQSEPGIVIAPQPATDHIELRLAGISRATLTLVNTQGRVVYLEHNIENGSKTIELSSLPRGMYFLHILDADGARETRSVVLN